MFLFYLGKHDYPAAPSRWINQVSSEKPGYSRAPGAHAGHGNRQICRDQRHRGAGVSSQPLAHQNQSVFRNRVDVQDYCINRLALERREHFIISCLDNQNRFISEEIESSGAVNHAAVCTREVVNAESKHQA